MLWKFIDARESLESHDVWRSYKRRQPRLQKQDVTYMVSSLVKTCKPTCPHLFEKSMKDYQGRDFSLHKQYIVEQSSNEKERKSSTPNMEVLIYWHLFPRQNFLRSN